MNVTDVVFRGNGATITFSDGSVGEAMYVTRDGTPTVIGLNAAQAAAWATYKQGFAPNLGTLLPEPPPSTTTATQDSNIELILSADDLPEPVGSQYVLAANTVYHFSGTVTIAFPLVMSEGTVITGVLGNSTIVYTGIIAAIIANQIGTTVIHFVNIVAPFAMAIDLTGESTYQSMLFFVGFVGCERLGNVTGYNVSSFKSCYFFDPSQITTTTGLTFSGTFNKILLDGCVFESIASANHAIIFSDNLVCRSIDIVGNYFKYDSTNSALYRGSNVVIDNLGLFTGNLVDGTVGLVLTEGFNGASVDWRFSNNSGIKDSQTIGNFHLSASALTNIVTINVPVKLAGTTVADANNERFSHSNGRLTFTGREDKTCLVNATVTLDASTNNQQFTCYFYKNEQIQPETAVITFVSSGSDVRAISLSLAITLSTGDYLEVWIANNTGNGDVTAIAYAMSIIGF